MMENLEQILKRIHAERYETNDKGFGRLYADIFKDKHRYNPQRKDFMLYDGKRWIDDTEGLAAKLMQNSCLMHLFGLQYLLMNRGNILNQ